VRLLGLLLLLPLVISSCRKSRVVTTPRPVAVANTMEAGTFIDKAGTYNHADARGSSELNLSLGGTTVNWEIEVKRALPGGGMKRGTSRGGMSLKTAGDPWFVYLESPRRLWLFNGSEDLEYTLHDDAGSKGGHVTFRGKFDPHGPKVPDDVIRRLPPGLQKLFPPVAPATGRPSI